MGRIRFGVASLLLFLAACSTAPSEEQISLGEPVASPRVRGAERLTDGRRALNGAPWNSSSAAVFRGPQAHVLFDLGQSTPIEAAYVHGDNNDQFVLEVSEDGERFTTLWTAPTAGGSGLRPRWAKSLGGRGRFIRMSAIGGDSWVSASELQIFSEVPTTWPPRVAVDIQMTPSLWSRVALVVFALLAMLAALRHREGSLQSMFLWGATGISGLAAAYAIYAAWPVDASVINLSRAVVALVGCAAVLRLGLRPERAQRRALTALLGVMAFLSIATFYNFGHPQFYDAQQRKPTYVHSWDLRVYFPAVKYFDELGYDGVYLASVKAYADVELDGALDSIESVQLRDLRNYEMRTVAELADEIHGVEERFSTARWEELKRDMAYFWKSMGRSAYLDSLRDHGGNATPAWLLTAYMIYRDAEATEATLLRAALIDPLLLLLFFVVAWRTFGLGAALVCLIAYGATSVYQFGSNWGGSTLRNDWMVLLGLGVCALKSKRWLLAGALLGWAAMIRAFPALAILFLAVPVGWRILEMIRKRGEKDATASPKSELVPVFKVAAGVVLVVVALGTISGSTFGWEKSWGAWSQKISMHANRPNVNHLGLTASVSFDPDNLWHNLRARGEDPELWGPLTAQTMKDRRWLILFGMALYTLLALYACRGLRLSDAAVIGTMMIPIYFYPSNYYLHILFIWPLMLAAWRSPEREVEWSLVAAIVLAACAVQWFGWLIPGNYGQFLFWSGDLLVAIVLLLLVPLVGDRLRATAGTA